MEKYTDFTDYMEETKKNHEDNFVCKLGTKVILKSTGESGVIIGIHNPQKDYSIGFLVRIKGKNCCDAVLFAEEFDPVLE